MALTIQTGYLDELARKRAQAEALQRSMTQAATTGIGVLQGVEQRDAKAATDKRDYEMRLREVNERSADMAADNARADAADRESIRQFNVDNAGRVNRETAAGQRQTVLDEQARANADRDYQLRLAPVEAAKGERERATKQQALAAFVGTLDGGRIDEAAAADVAARIGVSIEEVRAAVNAAANARSEKNAATDLNTRKTEAQIAVDEANAAKLRRPPAAPKPPTPKPPTAYEQARIEALEEKRDAASAAQVEDVQSIERRLGKLKAIKEGAKNFNTGPVAGPVARTLGKWLPDASTPILGAPADALDVPERSAWEASVAETFNELLKERSGASVTTQEMARALLEMLHTGIDDSAFQANAQRIIDSYAVDLANVQKRLTPRSRSAYAQGVGAPTAGPGGVDDDGLDEAALDEYLGGP